MKNQGAASAQQADIKKVSNVITFHGPMQEEEPIDVGGGFVAFHVLCDSKEMPLILCSSSIKNIEKLRKGMDLSIIGELKEMQSQWIIEVVRIMVLPTDEQIKKMKD